jgi:hypothetical protein
LIPPSQQFDTPSIVESVDIKSFELIDESSQESLYKEDLYKKHIYKEEEKYMDISFEDKKTELENDDSYINNKSQIDDKNKIIDSNRFDNILEFLRKNNMNISERILLEKYREFGADKLELLISSYDKIKATKTKPEAYLITLIKGDCTYYESKTIEPAKLQQIQENNELLTHKIKLITEARYKVTLLDQKLEFLELLAKSENNDNLKSFVEKSLKHLSDTEFRTLINECFYCNDPNLQRVLQYMSSSELKTCLISKDALSDKIESILKDMGA